MNKYLQETKMLNFSNKTIQSLIEKNQWVNDDEFQKIKNIYDFVRNDIAFGYSIDDTIPASMVLKDGYGQCNTKGTLFMALLRAVGIPCRIHGFTIDKKLQKGAMTGLIYKLAPQSIIHSWVEIQYNGNWYNLEGFILDNEYLKKLQKKFPNTQSSFCGYGVATDNFHNPQVEWNVNDTYIQKEGINCDFGIFYSPDEFFEKYQQRLSPLKIWFYRNIGRKLMNRNVKKIRA
ncbi:transglutaminase-like domain-containing protein [Anaerocolumna sp. MB42-C2]|uniref:transglutaminase-like domain-containing protein n=1 Tax=Anaerocolumna sp. MB42-C2 TaxID=3070997 RepID=UPI0027E028B5|nr:transglutaminase-like domain-containing protein [Anaerocolumna sp. MB42-C2]WMJ90443.1 transglutaminase-like domain-containing protein [Anaerocolumna sp. MB42-C2]